MIRNVRTTAALAFAASLFVIGMPAAHAQDADAPPRQHWSFAGPFGQYDPQQLQRGFKIYKEVCSNCHSLKLLSFRNLADPGGPGFSEAQAAAVAAMFQVTDGPNDQGQMFQRPGKIADYFPPPFANDQAARVALGGGLPPDMSVLAKARSYEAGFPRFIIDAFTEYQEDGPDYIHAIINGYAKAPADFTQAPGTYYNKYFPGHAIAMAAFLMWAAEPKLDERKHLGFQVMVFLFAFTGLLYFTKKKVWHAVDPDAPAGYRS
jgi:cytochrome c1